MSAARPVADPGALKSLAMVERLEPLEPLELPLRDAHGCVLASDVRPVYPVPSFPTATCSGVAVSAATTTYASSAQPVDVEVVDHLTPGFGCDTAVGERQGVVRERQGVSVVPGAMVPARFDAVVPTARTAFPGPTPGTIPTNVVLTQSVQAGQNVAAVGSVLSADQVVLTKGTQLDATAIAAAASVGRARTLVHPSPRVLVITLGDELLAVGCTIVAGLVHDATTAMLLAAVREVGGVPVRGGPIPNSARALADAVTDQLGSADLVLVATPALARDSGDSAGRSKRDGDVVTSALRLLGRSATLHDFDEATGTRIGSIGPKRTPLVCVESGAAPARAGFAVLVGPVIDRLAGRAPRVVAAVARSGPGAAPGLREFPAQGLYGADSIMANSAQNSRLEAGDKVTMVRAAAP